MRSTESFAVTDVFQHLKVSLTHRKLELRDRSFFMRKGGGGGAGGIEGGA